MRTLAIVGLLLLADASAAEACSTCTVGDPTITVVGVGQPYRNRVRLSAGARQRRERVGLGTERLELLEHRFELGVAWAATERWVLSAMLPLVQQRVRYPNLAEERRFGLGDAELRARVVLYRDRTLAPRHLLSGILGLELPTGTRVPERDDQVTYDLQTGSGSVDPIAGVLYSRFAAPHSVHAMAAVVVPTPGRYDVRGGTSGRALVRYQWQPRSVGLEVGVDGRIDGMDRVDGALDADSGGAILWLSAGGVARAGDDLVFRVVVSVPVVQSLRGGHREGVALLGTVVLDV
ncbi:MAG: hypothetical protein JJ863_18815 [Deltaproteobacteria bacterium]|nr:hypothetical protein [Deltaproteobacteria bacterium]